MTDELEDQDSLQPEGEQDTTPETEPTEVTIDDYHKVKEIAKNQKVRAEKAEKELKALKAQASKPLEKETPKNEPQSDEPDYSKLAFLEGRKVSHPDDQKVVLDEASRLKLPLTDILGMEHVKSKLKDMADQREASSGMPGKGKGKAGGTGRTDVDYWLAKGQAPDDPDLADKYFEARLKQEGANRKFDPIEE